MTAPQRGITAFINIKHVMIAQLVIPAPVKQFIEQTGQVTNSIFTLKIVLPYQLLIKIILLSVQSALLMLAMLDHCLMNMYVTATELCAMLMRLYCILPD